MARRRKDNSLLAALGVTIGAVLVILGIFNITAFVVSQDPTLPTWWDQTQALDALDQGEQNTLSACWKDAETYVPRAKLETTVNGEAITTGWEDTTPLTGEGSVLIGTWTPGVDGPDCSGGGPVAYCIHFEEVDTETCNIVFKPGIPQCECWCAATVVLCNASSFAYDVPEDACGAVSWRIFGQDVSGNENVTDSMSFDVNDVSAPTYGTQTQASTSIAAGETNTLSVVCMDECGLSKATLMISENGTFEEYESTDITGKQQEVSFNWSNPLLSEQDVEWKIVCEDEESNTVETSVLSFTIGEADDTEAPVLVSLDIDNQSPEKGDVITITAAWSDNKELSSSQLEINGAVLSTKSLTGTSDTATFTWTTSEAGQFTLMVKASDNAGNSASSDTTTINVAGICPTCPEPSDWGKCIKGEQTRTSYKCDASTSYNCQAYIEKRTCTTPGISIPLWLLISVIAVAAGVGIVAYFMMKKPAAAKAAAVKTKRL